MAQGKQFLELPEQQALFSPIKSGRAGEQRDDTTLDYEDEEEPEEDARLIPRCSPIPRKRGSSIADETAEYLRMRLALSRRVSFADAGGADLVHVREFVAFDSDEDEEESGSWEEEEAQRRRSYLEPVYSVWPEFPARADSELLQAVQANRVEVERVNPVPERPRAFEALICVWNVCYHKRVTVRFTTDGWLHHSELPAEFLHSAPDRRTDRFSACLEFAEPFLFNGARIDFVVRYETSDEEFWANNSGRNYSVTLLVSFEDKNLPKTEDREVRGILKPSRYRMGNDYDLSQENNEGDMANAKRDTECEECFQTICPDINEPEIDIEMSEAQAVSSSKTREGQIPTEHSLLVVNTCYDEEAPQDCTVNPSSRKSTEISDQATKSDLIGQREGSVKSNQLDSRNEVDSHADSVDKVPFELNKTLLGSLVSHECTDEGHSLAEQLKEEKRKGTARKEEILLDQTSNETHSLKKSTTSSKHKGEGEYSLSTREVQHESLVQKEISSEEQDSLTGGSLDTLEEVQPCMWTLFGNIQSGENRAPQSGLTKSEPRESQYQRRALDSKLNRSVGSESKSLAAVSLSEWTDASKCKGQKDISHNTSYDITLEGLEITLVEKPEMDMTELGINIRTETSTMLSLGGKEESLNLMDPHMQQPFETSNIIHTRDDQVTVAVFNLPKTSEPELSKYEEQRSQSEPELEQSDIFKSKHVSEGKSTMASVTKVTPVSFKFTTAIKEVSHEDGKHSVVPEEEQRLAYKKMELFENKTLSWNEEGLKSQPPLPCETSSSQTNEILKKTLIPSFAFLTIVVCLVIGFHKPTIFLIVVLFLVSLCF